MTVDLHLHSDVSDGIASPGDVVRRAVAVGLRTIALADHDALDGIAAAVEVGRELGAQVVPAVELTARVGPAPLSTVHVLAYGIDPASEPLQAVARRSRLGKRVQVERILERLAAAGIEITPEEVGLAPGEDRYVGRNRVASALVRRGLAKDRLKAFRRFLSPGARAFAEPDVASAAEVVAAIKSAGGIAVLAHPTDEDLDRHLGPLLELGIEGIELYRPKLAGPLLHRAEEAARRHGLLVTGGSDWHGLYPGPPLGAWKVLPEKIAAFLERLGQ